MQTGIFVEWFAHFISCAKSTCDRPVLLVIGGHSIHTKNRALIDKAHENNVQILCPPPYCTHSLQPLGVTMMRPISLYYNDAIRIWLRNYPNRVVTIYQIAGLFDTAYSKAATARTAVNGFATTGIVPYNRGVFGEADFVGTEPTDLPIAPSSDGNESTCAPATSGHATYDVATVTGS